MDFVVNRQSMMMREMIRVYCYIFCYLSLDLIGRENGQEGLYCEMNKKQGVVSQWKPYSTLISKEKSSYRARRCLEWKELIKVYIVIGDLNHCIIKRENLIIGKIIFQIKFWCKRVQSTICFVVGAYLPLCYENCDKIAVVEVIKNSSIIDTWLVVLLMRFFRRWKLCPLLFYCGTFIFYHFFLGVKSSAPAILTSLLCYVYMITAFKFKHQDYSHIYNQTLAKILAEYASAVSFLNTFIL